VFTSGSYQWRQALLKIAAQLASDRFPEELLSLVRRWNCPLARRVVPRFNQVHLVPAPRPTMVDLTNKRATAAHSAAKPTVSIP
jgi:hypothetical protein